MIAVAHRLVQSVAAAGMLCAAALGFAGSAAAAAVDPQPVLTAPQVDAVPQTTAEPAAVASPGMWWHRHHPSLLNPPADNWFIAPGS